MLVCGRLAGAAAPHLALAAAPHLALAAALPMHAMYDRPACGKRHGEELENGLGQNFIEKKSRNLHRIQSTRRMCCIKLSVLYQVECKSQKTHVLKETRECVNMCEYV